MMTRIFGMITTGMLVATLSACGGSGSNPVTGGGTSDDTASPTNPGADPNDTLTDAAFLFEPSQFLIANQFTFDPATNQVVINNLPFDGVSSEGGAYTPRAGVVLPNGEAFENTPGPGEDLYLAVVLVSPTGSGALVGAVGTNGYRGFGYGGAYVSRPSSGLPAARPAAYQYQGGYNGVRVIRQAPGPNNAIQMTTGTATLNVDILDIDGGGSIKGFINGRQLFSDAGTPLGALETIILNETTIDTATATTNEGGTADTRNLDGESAQAGQWTGLFSGPNGEEVVGYVLIEGALSDQGLDPNYDAAEEVTGREVGGFIVQQVP